jgi:peptidoglycan hydrolase CwlO-like protein
LQNNHGNIQSEIDKLKSQLRSIERDLKEFAEGKKILREEIGKIANQ